MNKTHHTSLIILLILIISLASILLLPSIPFDDFEMTCTARCKPIQDDTAWEACMLQCHEGRSK